MKKETEAALKRLMRYSWSDIRFEYKHLTPTEKNLVSEEEHKELVAWLESSPQQLPDKLPEMEFATRQMYQDAGSEPDFLEEWGKDGWQLAAVIPHGFVHRYYFQRPKRAQ